jgi:hypothetical protein
MLSKHIRRVHTLLYFIPLFIGIYLLQKNIPPFKITKETSLRNTNEVPYLGPSDRISMVGSGLKIVDNLIYIDTKFSYKYDHAKVRINFLPPSIYDQDIKMGYRNNTIWHYSDKILYFPVLYNLSWKVVGNNPYLYQKNSTYDLIEKFYSNPPTSSTIGFYNYDRSDFINSSAELPNYEKLDKKISLNIPLRGKHVMYAYLQEETFQLEVEKRDLNWYEDPDPMDIKIYKDDDVVYQDTIPDDGIADASKKLGNPQTITLKNPGPDLPEPGIYKIVFEGSSDTVITKLTTNLNRLIFEGPVFPINNAEAYKGLVSETKPVELYSNSNYYTFNTVHNASLQNIAIDEQGVYLTEVPKSYTHKLTGPREIHKLVLPNGGDVVINGTGFFSFSPDRFFEPLPFNSLQIKNKSDLDQVDYILTSYKPTQKIGDDRVAEIEFDLSDAVIQKGKLSWLISAPGLKESGGEILIKDIEFTFTKKGWFQ